MADYLQPVGKAWRMASIIGCTLTSIFCLMLSFLLWWARSDRLNTHDSQEKPLLMAAAIVGSIGIALGFIAWRITRRRDTTNGLTVFPAWFIQLFGGIFLSGLCVVAYYRGITLSLVQAMFIGLAMIFIGRHMGKKQKPRT